MHVTSEKGGVPQLCFHYDPELISNDRIQSLAKAAGAEIVKKFGHKFVEFRGIDGHFFTF